MRPDSWTFPPELIEYMDHAATRPTPHAGPLMVHRVLTGQPPPRSPRKADLFNPAQWGFHDAA